MQDSTFVCWVVRATRRFNNDDAELKATYIQCRPILEVVNMYIYICNYMCIYIYMIICTYICVSICFKRHKQDIPRFIAWSRDCLPQVTDVSTSIQLFGHFDKTSFIAAAIHNSWRNDQVIVPNIAVPWAWQQSLRPECWHWMFHANSVSLNSTLLCSCSSLQVP